MEHFKVSIKITCENPEIKSGIDNTTRHALNSLGYVDVVMAEDRWDYLIQYSVVKKPSDFLDIAVKYCKKPQVSYVSSHQIDLELDTIKPDVFEIPIEELPEFCRFRIAYFRKFYLRHDILWQQISQQL